MHRFKYKYPISNQVWDNWNMLKENNPEYIEDFEKIEKLAKEELLKYGDKITREGYNVIEYIDNNVHTVDEFIVLIAEDIIQHRGTGIENHRIVYRVDLIYDFAFPNLIFFYMIGTICFMATGLIPIDIEFSVLDNDFVKYIKNNYTIVKNITSCVEGLENLCFKGGESL